MKKRILLVDDDIDLVVVLRRTLLDRGYQVETATSGPEALEKARSCTPDVIVLDLVLPETDGFVVCEALKRDFRTATIPVLIITGLTSQLARYNGLECGADAYLNKPFNTEVLLKSIQSLMNPAAHVAVSKS